jgi:hypothetical protein
LKISCQGPFKFFKDNVEGNKENIAEPEPQQHHHFLLKPEQAQHENVFFLEFCATVCKPKKRVLAGTVKFLLPGVRAGAASMSCGFKTLQIQ